MSRQSSFTVRLAPLGRAALSFENAISIGLKSGEKAGRYRIIAPTAAMAWRTPSILWVRRLMGWTPPSGICVPEWVVLQTTKEASMEQIITVGLDLAKHVFQVHGTGVNGAVVLRKKLRREQLLGFFAKLPRCTVAMEACGGAHHWAREIARLGHEVKLIAPAYVKPSGRRCLRLTYPLNYLESLELWVAEIQRLVVPCFTMRCTE